MNAPRSFEGCQVWDLVGRLGGQVRVAPTGGVVGWDMGAAMALAVALGVDPAAVGYLLPPLEAVMVRTVNRKNED
ncbi:MAG: hypothetical protein D6773_16810 [Alphaproteobacteria bacterium]|nr:MAG: hypothetical protein D6773_16810 [Alphaproteobacteria bacterium]